MTTTRLQIPALYWEDLEEGLEDVSPGRTITEADLVNFAGLSGDFNQVHTDAVFAAESGLTGERLVYGLLGLAIMTGLFSRTAMGAGFQAQMIALMEVNWTFKAPLRVGDTVHVRGVISARRPTSNPGRGVIELSRQLINQHGIVTQEGVSKFMITRAGKSS
jgi:3-hydroxybutyryl-CoA dehydratase